MERIEIDHIINELKLQALNNFPEILNDKNTTPMTTRIKIETSARNSVFVHFADILSQMIIDASNSETFQSEVVRMIKQR